MIAAWGKVHRLGDPVKLKHLTLHLLTFCAFGPANAAVPNAKKLVHAALDAQGGEQNLRALSSVQWEASGFRNELEQSERPEGPYIVQMNEISEIHDVKAHRYRYQQTSSLYPVARFTTEVVVADHVAMRKVSSLSSAGPPTQVAQPGTLQQVEAAEERMALSPERLLLTALESPDLHSLPDIILQDVPQNVFSFTLDGAPVKVYLNAYTHLPTAIDYSGPLAHSNFWNYLGDVTMRIYFSFWWLAKNGIHMPLQWNVEENGLQDSMFVIRKLQIDEPLKEPDLTIPGDVLSRYQADPASTDLDKRPLGIPGQPAQELEPGIFFIPGAWNATFIKQEDGIVILEAPISSGYSEKVIAEAKRRIPGLPIKGVITTSDAWPHLAGIREYVAQGIPVYALDLNRSILERVILSKRTTKPDDLERKPRKAIFHLVSEKTILGIGKNRMELYPLRGETSERQLMIYFPEYHLLYGSDPFQQRSDGTYFYPQTVSEVVDAVTREQLSVDKFFMMHIGLTPWADLDTALAATRSQNTPDGVL
jgi:hypothetical protein